jgi:hypothetical protein
MRRLLTFQVTMVQVAASPAEGAGLPAKAVAEAADESDIEKLLSE